MGVTPPRSGPKGYGEHYSGRNWPKMFAWLL